MNRFQTLALLLGLALVLAAVLLLAGDTVPDQLWWFVATAAAAVGIGGGSKFNARRRARRVRGA